MIRFWDMSPVSEMLLGETEQTKHLDGSLAIHKSKGGIVEGFVDENVVFTMFDLSGKLGRISSLDNKWINIETINTKEQMALASYVINFARENNIPCYLRDSREN